MRSNLNWPHEPFHIDETIYASWNAKQSEAFENEWNKLTLSGTIIDLAAEFLRRMQNRLPENWRSKQKICCCNSMREKQAVASRKGFTILSRYICESVARNDGEARQI